MKLKPGHGKFINAWQCNDSRGYYARPSHYYPGRSIRVSADLMHDIPRGYCNASLSSIQRLLADQVHDAQGPYGCAALLADLYLVS
jgi:hypothetical protein